MVTEDLNWKAGGKICLGLVPSSNCPCGWNPVRESTIRRFWQMYTGSIESESVPGDFPSPATGCPTPQVYWLLESIALKAAELTGPHSSQNTEQVPGIKEKVGTANYAISK